jgi:hypothetical protein
MRLRSRRASWHDGAIAMPRTTPMGACAPSDTQVRTDSFADKKAAPQGCQNVRLASDESS